MIPTPDQVDLVLYHASCFDGFTAAWVAWLCRGDAAEYIPVFHGEPPPWEDVAGRHVAILDFAYKRPVLEQMAAEAASLVVLDHHKSAQADLEGLDYAIFDMDRSGARLAYDWWLGEKASWIRLASSPGPRVNAVERLCDYIQDRDLWRWQLPNSREISEALKITPFDFREWSLFCQALALNSQGLVATGGGLLAMTKQHLSLLAKMASIARLDEHRVWVANAPYIYASELGNLLCNEARERAAVNFDDAFGIPEVAAIWRYDHAKQRMSWSLRSSETSSVDVSKIAVAHGGGGHFHAAGFEVETADPWTVLQKL